jgi:hypothetical protein
VRDQQSSQRSAPVIVGFVCVFGLVLVLVLALGFDLDLDLGRGKRHGSIFCGEEGSELITWRLLGWGQD